MNVSLGTSWAAHASTLDSMSEMGETESLRLGVQMAMEPTIDAAWSQRDMWNVIDQVSTAELGGASNAARHRSLAEIGGAALERVSTHGGGVVEGPTDLEQVVSQYMGETEKRLDRVFGGARASGAMLLLDEADALLDRRTEVRDSHDRYASTETGLLLQGLERHDRVADD